ncbi:jg17768 [Pararge aegeria aegeria]|uniref:Jg17768 protein n=1 Tax=Pararge aegeria aegeria TaxID=348720 RepID=A0A8S4R935_9NEOP|nr:jg17768 [Pararge aegeria aegeria]
MWNYNVVHSWKLFAPFCSVSAEAITSDAETIGNKGKASRNRLCGEITTSPRNPHRAPLPPRACFSSCNNWRTEQINRHTE